MLSALKSRIGVEHTPTEPWFNTAATPDAIRHFANGIGDDNPLYCDADYAAKTKYGRLVAPPLFLYSIYWPIGTWGGLPGIHAFHSGNDWEFYRPAYLGDTITPECVFTGFDVKTSKFAGKMVMERQRSSFLNQNGTLLAKTDLWLVRAERKAARETGKYHSLTLPHPWTEKELAKVEEDVLSEEVRGSNPRYWEDVKVGDEMKPVVKGPLGLTDIIAYCVGAAPVQIMAHGQQLRLYRKHPAWAFRDPTTCALEPVYGVHYNKAAAAGAGLPYPYDVGAQRQCWLLHLLTNWMGDDGWIKKNRAEYRRFVYLSDVVYLQGKITEKYIDENGEPCVNVEHHSINQRGEDVMPGSSTIILPSREKKTSPVTKRK